MFDKASTRTLEQIKALLNGFPGENSLADECARTCILRAMKIDISFKEIESSDGIKKHIEERAQKLEQFIAPDEHLNITVGAKFKGQQHYADIYWHDNRTGADFRSASEGHDLYIQIDEIFEKVLKQVRQVHEKNIDAQRKRTPSKRAHLD